MPAAGLGLTLAAGCGGHRGAFVRGGGAPGPATFPRRRPAVLTPGRPGPPAPGAVGARPLPSALPPPVPPACWKGPAEPGAPVLRGTMRGARRGCRLEQPRASSSRCFSFSFPSGARFLAERGTRETDGGDRCLVFGAYLENLLAWIRMSFCITALLADKVKASVF